MKYLSAAVVAAVLATCTPVMATSTPVNGAPGQPSVTRPKPMIIVPYCTSKRAVMHIINLYQTKPTAVEGNAAWAQYVKTGKCFNTPATAVDARPVGKPFALVNSPTLIILQVMQATRDDGVFIYYLNRVG